MFKGFFLIIPLFLALLPLYAQHKVLKQSMFNDLEVVNSITKSYQDSTVTFHLKVLDDERRPDFAKRYYWFHQGEIKSTVGNFTGRLLHGPYEKYDRNGTLLEKGTFEYGLKEGSWITWYGNGTIARHYEWKNGFREGKFEKYLNNGWPQQTGVYHKDKLHGVVYEYAQGQVISKTKFHHGDLVKEKVKKVKTKKQAEGTTEESTKTKKKHRKKEADTNVTPPVTDQPEQQPTEVVKEKKKKREKKTAIQSPDQLQVNPQPVIKESRKERRKKKKALQEGQMPVQP